MKLNKKSLLALFAALLLLFAAGCSAGAQNNATADSAPSAPNASYQEIGEMDMGSGAASESAPSGETGGLLADGALLWEDADPSQKMIYTVSIEGETHDFDGAVSGLTGLAAELGGYVEASEQYGRVPTSWGESGRNAYLTLRLPTSGLTEFLQRANELIDIYSQSASAENITNAYYDTEARKESYEAQLTRLRELLAEAQDLADVLAIESEITRVQYELDSLTGQLKQYDNQVEYSTVHVRLYELSSLERPQSQEPTLGERIGDAFTDGLRGAGEAAEDFAVWLVRSLPALLVIAVLVVVVVLLVKRHRKKRYPAGRPRRKDPPVMPPPAPGPNAPDPAKEEANAPAEKSGPDAPGQP